MPHETPLLTSSPADPATTAAGVFGAYLLAVYDPEAEVYQTISKLGTGFSEEQLKELADSLRPHIIPQPRAYYSYGETLVPDVWFDSVKVWEVKAADLSISPVHKAAQGLVDPAKGISIRWAAGSGQWAVATEGLGMLEHVCCMGHRQQQEWQER